MKPLNITIFGLSITSSWGNGHATTFRGLIKALAKRGHQITFFEKDMPWYARNRDMPTTPFCTTVLYQDVDAIDRYREYLAKEDLVIIGSFVADTSALLAKLKQLEPRCLAFYDIDTPVTLAKLERGECGYLSGDDIPKFDCYLSFTGGPILHTLKHRYGAQRAWTLHCSVDPGLYYPQPYTVKQFDLGYLGTYSADRQPTLEKLLSQPAARQPRRRFHVAGAQYPQAIQWPDNVERTEHIPPNLHRAFYSSQRFTLNVTRQDMVHAGYSPSVRLFEAAACGTPIISDMWPGLGDFFEIGSEILVAGDGDDIGRYLSMPEPQRRQLGERLRNKVLRYHTNEHRAQQLEQYWSEVAENNEAHAFERPSHRAAIVN